MEGNRANTLDLAHAAARAADSKKARDIVILDMRGLVAYTDYLVICTGQTPRQTKAIADEVRHVMKHEMATIARRVEGEREGDWILVDFLDIVFHCFTPDSRDFYRLDRLWRDAPREELTLAAAGAAGSDGQEATN